MKIKHIYILYIIVLVCCASCITRGNYNYVQERSKLPQYDSVGYSDYRLQKGDYIDVRINSMLKEDEQLFNGGNTNRNVMSGDNAQSRLYLYLVEEDGCITFPYVGKVQVLDKTLRDVKHLLEAALKDMMRSFSVDVRLANGTFSIIGESGAGRYRLPKEKVNIFQALAMSGDLSDFSDKTKVRLIRQTSNGTIVKEFDLRTRSIINSEYYYIQPNDVIYVQFNDAKYFGVTHVTGLISTVLSTISVGLLIYGLVIKYK